MSASDSTPWRQPGHAIELHHCKFDWLRIGKGWNGQAKATRSETDGTLLPAVLRRGEALSASCFRSPVADERRTGIVLF